MAVTVSGTSITFNDGSVQTSAGGAVNTTAVLNATAGATNGAVGTYASLAHMDNASAGFILPGTNIAGSSLRYAGGHATMFNGGVGGIYFTTALSGTWKCMGAALNANTGYNAGGFATLFLRIS